MFYQPQDLINKTVMANYGRMHPVIEGTVEYIKVNKKGDAEITVSFFEDSITATEPLTETINVNIEDVKPFSEMRKSGSVIGVWVH